MLRPFITGGVDRRDVVLNVDERCPSHVDLSDDGAVNLFGGAKAGEQA